ncbi:hypothetical protein T492DRAFT_957154 [Pavlovales sp. CCMP2436]|nr:hypothetical protein T492DRAFT_957154 [Pavlovales sp. CCMP2436]
MSLVERGARPRQMALLGLLAVCLAGPAWGGEMRVVSQTAHAQPLRLRWDNLRSALRRDGLRLHMPPIRQRKRNVLILMSDTGGGHRASALALKAAMEELNPNRLNVTIVDMYASCSSLPWRWLPQMYRRLAKRPLQWWLAVHLFADFKPMRWFMEGWINYATSNGLRQCLEAHEPEIVVSMHAMTSIYPMHALRRLGGGRRRIPVVTVVTDLTTVHPAWFDKGVDVCFVASDEAAKLARAKGLKQSQLRQYGLPIHPMFGRKNNPNKPALRRKIGAKPGKPLVLLVGGGDGVGGIGRLADTVAHELGQRFPEQMQLMIVCGKNEKVRAELSAKHWEGVDVYVLGFVKPMCEYMAASDCIITKAGPGTVMEAASQGLPTMLSGANPKMLADMSVKAKLAARPGAVYAIAQDICNMLPSPNGKLSHAA